MLDTSSLMPLSPQEQTAYETIVQQTEQAVEADSVEARRTYALHKAEQELGESVDDQFIAQRATEIEQLLEGGTLPTGFTLQFDSLGAATTDDVLADPERFHNATLSDPFEPEQGPNKAIAYTVQDRPLIYSHLHGGIKYYLAYTGHCPAQVLTSSNVSPQLSANLANMTTADQLVQRYIYVMGMNRYFDTVTGDLLDPKVLDKMHAAQFPGRGKVPTATKAFDMHPGKIMVQDIGWLPTTDRIIYLDGRVLVNTYRGIQTTAIAGPVDDWLTLVAHVFGDYTDIFLNHLAFSLQHPDKKIRWQILVVSVVRRTGKSLVFRVIKQIWGNACKVVSADDLNAGWGDHFAECKILIIEELYEKPGSNLFDKLKSKLANDDREALNMKGSGICYQQNVMSMYMTTNHIDALRFDEAEDKLLVVKGPDGTIFPNDRQRSDEFYARVGAWSDSVAGQSAALDYLLNRDITGFNPNRLPVRTDALKEMCAASSPDYQSHIQELIDAVSDPFDKDFVKLTDIKSRLRSDGYDRPSDKGIKDALINAGWFSEQAQEGSGQKRKSRFWLRPDSPAATMTKSALWTYTSGGHEDPQ